MDVFRWGVNYTVTRLADHAFQGCAKITGNLVIPATVRRLGGYDFQNCTGFAGSIEIVGSPVVEFGDRGSFWNCNNATSAIIGPGVTNVINDLFRDGKKLEGVWVKGRRDVAPGTQDYSIISQNSPVRSAAALKVFLLGKNTRFSNKIGNLTVLDVQEAFGLDTHINVTNTIEIASDLITAEKLANATFNSLTFKVNTQAQRQVQAEDQRTDNQLLLIGDSTQ